MEAAPNFDKTAYARRLYARQMEDPFYREKRRLRCKAWRETHLTQAKILSNNASKKQYHKRKTDPVYMEKRRERNRVRYVRLKGEHIKRRLRALTEGLNITKAAVGCQLCGAHNRRLVFHHIDPLIKSFNIHAQGIAGRTADEQWQEVAKCLVLCYSCHTIIHR